MGKEESISSHEPLELGGEDAGEGGTNKAVRISGLLSKTTTEAVNLIYAGVDFGQVVPVFVVDLKRWLIHRGEGVEPAEGPHAVVGRDSMVTTSLDVPSCQVVAKSCRVVFDEQVVGQIVDHKSVGRWAGLLGCLLHLTEPLVSSLDRFTKDKVVKLKEMTLERPSTVAQEETGNQRVAKAVGNSCELVDN